jgi:DNA-binding transcriptional ArsR family regulator
MKLLQAGTGTVATDSGDGTLSKDVLFDILSNPRRRHALHYLKQQRRPVRVGEIAETLAAWEKGTAPEYVSSRERKRVYTSLYQAHLPKMHRAGVVDYDRDRGYVELAGSADALRIHLEVVERNDIPWSVFYLGLAGLFAGITAALWLDVFPFGLLSELVWMTAVVGVLLGCAAVNTYLDRRSRLGAEGPPPGVVDCDGREDRP